MRNKPLAAWLLAALTCLAAPSLPAAQTALADQPLFASSNVPGNVLLALSVEYPTADEEANYASYSTSSTFLGYFDPDKCYTYSYDSSHLGASLPAASPDPVGVNNPQYAYFKASSAATSHVCSGAWSGNFLNWATHTTIDPFRQALTGGYRVVDTASQTVVERTWTSTDGQDMVSCTSGGTTYVGYSSGDFPDRTISSAAVIAGATPLNGSVLTLHNAGEGNQLVFAQLPAATQPKPKSSKNNACANSPTATASNISNYVDSNVYASSTGRPYLEPQVYSGQTIAATDTGVYSLAVRVQVCDATVSLESNCVAYGSNYKPEGLMQQYSQTMRFGVFGYLDDSSRLRDGGVLRARMNFVGPTYAVYGSGSTANPYAEWSATDGTFITNPDSGDAADTNSHYGLSGSGQVGTSGAINYLNKFGETSRKYKTYDNVSELYYAAQRYFRNLPKNTSLPAAAQIGNVPQWTDGYAGYGDNPVTGTDLDGFPVIASWYQDHNGNAVDPIQYACQQNFIIGIGDVNTHADGNLPGNPSFDSQATFEPTLETAVANDTTVNTEDATNQVGVLEGLGSSLGDTAVSWCCSDGNTYGIAGLAYDAHVSDIRPDLSGTQTISTYWLDVQEYQTYRYRNQFWLAAKYGGFTVPSSWSEYSSKASDITLNMWNASGRTDAGFSGGTGAALPDHYFSASRPDLIQSGLQAAFKSIAAQVSETTTAFSSVSINFSASTCNAIYGAGYSSRTWTGSVVALSVSGSSGTCLSTDSGGNIVTTQQWDAGNVLEQAAAGTGWKSRIIATSSATGAGNGIPFESSSLSTAELATFGSSGASYVNYLRGDRSNEGSNGSGSFRARTKLLGDVVNSQVVAVGAPSQIYTDSNNPGYSTFKSKNSGRGTVIYVGANDGMLHAFDGSVSGSTQGAELFAYVPSLLFGGPSSPSSPSANGLASLGNSPLSHHYFVDSTPTVQDVDFGRTSGNTKAADWRTVLVGGLGKGGMGYYALDITKPAGITSESALASDVLWEFTDPNMGYSYGPPTIVKTRKYGWVVLLPSGYNNADGVGRLYVVDPATGATLETISTGSGSTSSPSGLAEVKAFVPDYTDATADAAYAGDLNGDIWRFDLTATGTTAFSVTKLAHVTDGSNKAQPITARIELAVDPNTGRRWVLFGTGNLLDSSDIASKQVQAFYAIADGTNGPGAFFGSTSPQNTPPGGSSLPITRSELTADLDATQGTASSSTTVGWYIDMPAAGYQITQSATYGDDVVAWEANLPTSSDPCSPSGTHIPYAVALAQGKSVLVDSSGTTIAHGSSASGMGEGVVILSNDGQVTLLDTSNAAAGGHVLPATLGNSSTFQWLNWHEVDTSH